MPNLLFEIGTEEIPAGYIQPSLRQMKSSLSDRLKGSRLHFKEVYATATPRRLTIFVEGLDDKQESAIKEMPGPSYNIAYDANGEPTDAAKGFARSQAIDVKALVVKETKKGRYCYAIKTIEGLETIKLLPEILIWLIKTIDFPKKMIWHGKDIAFARPIRSLAALFGPDLIDFELNGIRTGRIVRGHPFLSSPEIPGIGKAIELEDADLFTYKQRLFEEKVIVDINERRNLLLEKINKIMARYNSRFYDDDLLDELTNLVEYPEAIECSFEGSFLDIPAEVTIAAMKGHQRYCPVINEEGKLLPKFIAVVNMDERDAERAREGNERVLRARLADARFFLEEDKKISLYKRTEGLKDVMFHERLGSYMDRTNRIVGLSSFIAQELGASTNRNKSLLEGKGEERHLLIEDVKRAAYLCKADLTTSMVGEFPELQGIMGRIYSASSGEDKEVSTAIEDHYLPRYANDRLPETEIGAIISLADRFDMVSGCFSIGLIPTGSQDPYGLRRSVQAIIRIIEYKRLLLSIKDVVTNSLSLLAEHGAGCGVNTHDDTLKQILEFFKDRIYQTYIERGYKYDLINAVLASGFDDLIDLSERMQTLSQLSGEALWPDLVTVVERTFNIGKKEVIEGGVNNSLLIEPEEKALWKIYEDNRDKIRSLIDKKDYRGASLSFSKVFAGPVHNFFDKVFVNVEDDRLRNNRQRMLKQINELYSNRIADLSKIVVDNR